MKNIITSFMAVFVFISASAQPADTISTVCREKLNFEAPLFKLSSGDIRPTWMMSLLSETMFGWNTFFNTPQINSGISVDIGILSLKYRPWKDENQFSFDLMMNYYINWLQGGYMFASDGSIVRVPSGTSIASADFGTLALSLQIGYVRGFGNWKGGLFVVPGIGETMLENFAPTGYSGVFKSDILSYSGFCLGLKAGIWYKDIGIAATYKPLIGNNHNMWPQNGSLSIGLSFRF